MLSSALLQLTLLLATKAGPSSAQGPDAVPGEHAECARVPDLECGKGVFSWCNMPHVTPDTYEDPPSRYSLEYVEVIQRHHKRTPYGSNIFPREDIEWSCDDVGVLSGLTFSGDYGTSAVVQRENNWDDTNPFKVLDKVGFVNSSCQFPQITKGGLVDSVVHGSDLRKVYGERLKLSSHYDPSEASFRITNNVITSQVASGLLRGFYPEQDLSRPTPVQIQPSSMDSLEPTYSCPRANALRDSFTTGNNGAVWREHLQKARDEGLWDELDSISGVPTDDRGWHVSFDHYFDNLSAKLCHRKPLPCNLKDRSLCISRETADKVFDIGHWEYLYLFREAVGSHEYSALKSGAWMLELRSRLYSKIEGTHKVRYAHNVAHDGSISSLLGFLQVEGMAWPGMGSEVVFELYRDAARASAPPPTTDGWYVRVLWSGQVMRTVSTLGVLDMVPLNAFFEYIDSTVGSGSELYNRCFTTLE
ncbi:hypothetical protein CC1G_10796 [Coprinopsis cinerea okayama7|uniref:Acid phosphatase n=1 Tax=Coprinopsis cinerea (strain Okayama-7 / 130 / ATCC MYA-4618 / FGSC 9003) TaxID=240176 RepID=A8NMI3_COPC7|nr:hypothetical protein CC1G_10796 [Coprinopsis cinerea okayama7\|eukprot:XP_001834922.2 hypothetical protein CC1G_10796 [Coprinopsis cinerea okayama7\